MVAISQTTFSNAFSWIAGYVIRISLKFVLGGQIDNNQALVRVMAWRGTGDRPLPEPMLTQFNDAYMR